MISPEDEPSIPIPRLANLLRTAARAGIAHYEDWIQFSAALLAIVHRLKHLFRDLSVNSDQMAMTLL